MHLKRTFKQKTIAVIYDFDGTLTPRPMQEYTVLPQLGITPDAFWREVREEAKRENADEMLTYMRLLSSKISAKQHIGRSQFSDLAKNIEYYDGVETWFPRINAFASNHPHGGKKTALRHYVISAGLKEILEGISIKRYFHNLFASEYYYDVHDVPTFPNVLVTDTIKTQYLFRINKGREEIHETINEHMPENERPIPFSNMLYIGDGMSDVPCMTVCKQAGGYAIAVYEPRRSTAKKRCEELLAAGRVDFIAPADYREGKELDGFVRIILDRMLADIRYHRGRHTQAMRLNPMMPSAQSNSQHPVIPSPLEQEPVGTTQLAHEQQTPRADQIAD